MSLALRRIRRLIGTGSPAAVARAARRAVALRQTQRELEAALRSDRPLVVGPFLGEVGYELLYWRPYVLRLLRSHRVDPERVTVVGRGGSADWYATVAARRVDAFELLPPREVLSRIEERVARTGQRKQLSVDALDRDLQQLATTEDAAPVHPLHMFWGSRFAWEGLVPAAEAVLAADHDPLPRGELPPAVAGRLPGRFVVLKAYFNECVPDTPESRSGYARLAAALARESSVVALQPGFAVDDHADWPPDDVVRVDDLLEPRSNLAVQAAIVARAEALVSTYGGFAYLGPYLGVPTTAVGEIGEENPHHEQMLKAARPDARYRRVSLAGAISGAAVAEPPRPA
jgi:hypothetical protein